MTLLFCEGFGVDTSKWDAINSASRSGSAGRYGDAGFLVQTDSGYYVRKDITPSATVTVGGAITSAQMLSSNAYGWHFMSDGGATTHLKVSWSALGTMTLYRGDNTVLATGTSAALILNSWLYLEVQATIADAGGTCKVRVNGTEIINFTGDTRNAGSSALIDRLHMTAMTNNMWLDDVYILNSLGARNNDFLGEVRVVAQQPTGAGASTGLTPISGSNWSNVNTIPFNDATYNFSATPGTRDTYALADITGTPTIAAVQVATRMLKSDAGAASMKPAIKSGATVAYGVTQALSATAKTYSDVFETDPNTAAPWTVAGVNALESGAEVA